MLRKYGYYDLPELSVPYDYNKKLRPNTGRPVEQLRYSKIIRSLMYVMSCTRPDIAFASPKNILHKLLSRQRFDLTSTSSRPKISSMLSSRFLSFRNLIISSSSSVLFPKSFTFQSKKPHNIYSSPSRVFRGTSSPISKSYPFSSPKLSFSEMASQSATSVHDFTVKDARGNDVDLSTYKGKVLLIVNVASQCGLTNSNYTELSQLYEKYKNQGLEVLAFPCNQFGAQEPGSNEEIVEFACTRFKAEYPIFDKVDVNGDNAAPIYKFLKSSKGSLFGDNIKWNFSKFLVDKDGHVLERYAPTTSPLSIEKDIKKLLGVS
ncbi:probable phospholipid hydroperoxide glutathione peroxidase [Asparagus officinalis]|nr:probable phospholipid hydroperoxide glutathione peroxidase [Asparagus officinalis]